MFVHFIMQLTTQPGPGVGHAKGGDLAKAGAAAGCPAAPPQPSGEPAEEESVYTGALVPGALHQPSHREDRAAAAFYTFRFSHKISRGPG